MEIDFCPRWVLTKFGVPLEHQHHIALLVSAALSLVLVPLLVHVPHYCLTREILGISCPGCGVSRSLVSILRLDPVGAWAANPAGIGVAFILAFQVLVRPLALVGPVCGGLISRFSRCLSTTVVGGLFLVWIFRVV
jgi:hypothetical protein